MNLKMALKIFRMELASKLTYRGKLLVDVLIMSSKLLVPVLTWASIYKGREVFSEYSYSEMLSYVVIANFIGAFFSLNHGSVFANLVKQGRLSFYLLRPTSLISEFAPRFAANTTINTLLAVFPAAAFFAAFGIKAPIEMSLPALTVLFASWMLAFQFGFLFGILSFWITEMWAVAHLVRSLMVIAGGLWFPLDLLPFGIGDFLQYSPFAYFGYVNIKALSGGLPSDSYAIHLLVLFIWIGLFALISPLLLKKGLKRYEAVGI